MENIGRWGKEVPIFHGAVPRLALLLFKAMKMRFLNQKHAFRGASDSERREMRSTSIRGASAASDENASPSMRASRRARSARREMRSFASLLRIRIAFEDGLKEVRMDSKRSECAKMT